MTFSTASTHFRHQAHGSSPPLLAPILLGFALTVLNCPRGRAHLVLLSHREPPVLFAEIEVGATAMAFRQMVRLLREAQLISREGSAASYVQ